MGVLDVKAIRAEKEDEERARAECRAWCAQALSEFLDAATELETPMSSVSANVKPAWPVTHRNEKGEWAGCVVLARKTTSDNATVNLMWSAVVAPSGQFYKDSKPSTLDEMASYLASISRFDVDEAKDLFRLALLGRPVAVA